MLNIKTNTKTMICVCISLFISACGGSGGGGETGDVTADPTPVPTAAPVTESEGQSETVNGAEELVDVALETMNNLKAEPDFTFTNKQQVSITLDLSEMLALHDQTGQRAYVSVYHEYTALPTGEFYPNASSRVLSGQVKDGQFHHSFIRLNNQPSYLVEVWFYNGDLPIQKEILVAQNNVSW